MSDICDDCGAKLEFTSPFLICDDCREADGIVIEEALAVYYRELCEYQEPTPEPLQERLERWARQDQEAIIADHIEANGGHPCRKD